MTSLRLRHHWLLLILVLMMSACGKKNVKEVPPCRCEPSITEPSKQVPEPSTPTPETKPEVPGSKIPEYGLLKPADWRDIETWKQDNLSAGWSAWITSCSTLKNKPEWQPACQAASTLSTPDNSQIIDYFTRYFNVYSTSTIAGSNSGLITGYYEPILRAAAPSLRNMLFPYTHNLKTSLRLI